MKTKFHIKIRSQEIHVGYRIATGKNNYNWSEVSPIIYAIKDDYPVYTDNDSLGITTIAHMKEAIESHTGNFIPNEVKRIDNLLKNKTLGCSRTSDSYILPEHYIYIEEPSYKGKGAHTINQLEGIISMYKERNHQQTIIKQSLIQYIINYQNE